MPNITSSTAASPPKNQNVEKQQEKSSWNSRAVATVIVGVAVVAIGAIYHKEIRNLLRFSDPEASREIPVVKFAIHLEGSGEPLNFIDASAPQSICSQIQPFAKNMCSSIIDDYDEACDTVSDFCKNLPTDFIQFKNYITGKLSTIETLVKDNDGEIPRFTMRTRYIPKSGLSRSRMELLNTNALRATLNKIQNFLPQKF